METFLPWPGSKKRSAGLIIEDFPAEFGTYYEPFLGSGSVFFALEERKFKGARLSDSNAKLINCFRAVKERPALVKGMLEHCLRRNSQDFYLMMRQQMANPAVFIYVMRAAFSSLYRENSWGEFNVPWRKQDYERGGKRISLDMSQLDQCSCFLNERNAELSVADFLHASQDAEAGDVVYFDPPYLPYTDTGFVNYVAGGFGEEEHRFLRAQVSKLVDKGVFVALSNSDVPASRRIYGKPYRVLSVTNAVKSTATTKGTRQEGLWLWRPKE